MPIRFIHTADIHLGKTCRNFPSEAGWDASFFLTLKPVLPLGMGAV